MSPALIQLLNTHPILHLPQIWLPYVPASRFAQRVSYYWIQKPNYLCPVTSSSSFMKLFIILPLSFWLIFMPIGHTGVSFLPYLYIRFLLLGLLLWNQPYLWCLQKNEGVSVGYARSMEAGQNVTKSSMTFLLISADSRLKFTFRAITIMY